MKRALIAGFGLLAATSLFAATDNTQQTTTATTTASAASKPATTAPTEDSPLVKAAKSTHRLNGGKSVVITNDDLKNSKGHITTTTVPIGNRLNIPDPQPSSEQLLLESKKKEKERGAKMEKEKQAAKTKHDQEVARAVAAAEDDGPYTEDPARTEHQLDQATAPPKTQTTPDPNRKQ